MHPHDGSYVDDGPCTRPDFGRGSPLRRRNHGPRASELTFQLEISPRAWTQIGTISSESFDRIRERIHELATYEVKPGPGRAPGTLETTLECDGLVVTLNVDPVFHMITLQRIARKLAA